MSNQTQNRSKNFFHSLPKIELHRHLEGSVRLETLIDVRRSLGLPLPETGQLGGLVQIGEGEELNFENFLSKFQTLRLFYRSPEVIDRITRETIEDAAKDNVRYLELRFTPVALGRAEDFPLAEVMDWVVDATREAAEAFNIKTGLIVSMNRHESPEIARDVVELAMERVGRGVVGVDLAGNEAEFSGLPFLDVFKEAKNAGLNITIHAGEWGSAENILEAILYLGADRIGHGVRVIENPEVIALARDRQIPFEVCVTSNYQSGVVPSLTVHPLPRMMSLGLNVTINTDDPSISQISLGDEYRLACEDLGLTLEVLRERILAAALAAFLPADEKLQLVSAIQLEFPQIP